jgi:hypothetical protein
MGNVALEKAKENKTNGYVELTTGYMGKITPVGATLVDEVVSSIEDPEVPVIFDEDKGREIENPNDPQYLRALEKAEYQRSLAAIDAMLLFGLELESIPEDDKWLKKLKYLEKKGLIDLSEYDMDDELDREFVFTKYIAVGTQDLMKIGREAGLNSADVEKAARTFQDN